MYLDDTNFTASVGLVCTTCVCVCVSGRVEGGGPEALGSRVPSKCRQRSCRPRHLRHLRHVARYTRHTASIAPENPLLIKVIEVRSMRD